jgi:hypothetical protein
MTKRLTTVKTLLVFFIAVADLQQDLQAADIPLPQQPRTAEESRVQQPVPAKLDFAWADKRWTDPLSGTEVVCISPPMKRHYRTAYFRINEMTWDGRYIVFTEFTEIRDGRVSGEVRIVARDLQSGKIIDLGPAPLSPNGSFEPTAGLAVARYSHRVNLIDASDPDELAIIQIDIDTGKRRRIQPSERLSGIYEASFDASERYCYSPWLKEKAALQKTMSPADFRAMVASQPGAQDMVRIDLETGKVESVFSSSSWWMGHPNPHPSIAELFMCCQEWYGENAASQWGACGEHQRIRVRDLNTGTWLHDTVPSLPWRDGGMGGHEHWASTGKRIWTHVDVSGTIRVSDLDRGTMKQYNCPPNQGSTWHVMVSPNERFLVGDGVELDRNMPADLRKKTEALDPQAALGFAKMNLWFPDGGETIWLYRIPETGDALGLTPLCKRRSMCRGQMFGQRLEANAHVTPDNRWAVFVSSSDDDWFEIWAARIPADLTE